MNPVAVTLLPDALDRTLNEPQCARRWHVLMAAWESSRDTVERALVVDTVKNLPGKDARTDVLRLSFLARASGDRERDVNDNLRARVLQRLRIAKAPASWLRMVMEVVELDEADAGRVFGETMPPGLRLVE